jgi:hypothetical protein
MNTASDIFAFATTYADYWTEFLSGTDYGAILSADEVKALEAARAHIEDSVYELFVQCEEKLATRLAAEGMVRRNVQRGPTIKNRCIRLDPPKAWRGRLYGLEFQFWPDPAGDGVLLFGSLVAKRGHIDNLAQNIASKGTPTFSAGRYHIYQTGISIEEGKRLDELADRAAAGVAELFIAAG